MRIDARSHYHCAGWMTRSVDSPHETKASRALSEKFGEKRSGLQKRCSERTGIEQSRLSKIAGGKAFPRADEAAKLEEEGIPVIWWTLPVEPKRRAS